MKYDINTGVQQKTLNMKKMIIAVVASAGMAAGFAVPAMAAGSTGSQASPCGAVHGAFADQNGNFGFLGQVGGTPGYHNGAVGQDAGATGFNNSHTSCQQ